MSINRQCQLLGLSRTAFYYNPKPVSEMDLSLLRLIHEKHLEYPAKGVIGMTDALREMHFDIGERHTRTLMRKMGVEAVCRRKSLSVLG